MIINPNDNVAVNLSEGNEATFEQLIEQHRIDEAMTQMTSFADRAAKAMAEYNPHTHAITRRENKYRQDKDGHIVAEVKRARLPVPYQVYINEVALVFLFGQPVRWQQLSDDTDDAFQYFQQVIKDTRFNAKIRQCKRIAGSETESAMLFRVYKDDDGNAALQLRVLAHSRGDELYTRFDQYDNLITFAWGYYLQESNNAAVYHIDIFTKGNVYYCRQTSNGWEVDIETNLVGKIPVILFRQEKEWAGVEALIEREEFIASRTADTNDYFADPIMIASADVLKNMPEKKDEAKVLVTNDTEGGVNNAVKYLTWDSAPQSKQSEITWLQEQILSKTFTPDIRLDTLKSLGNLSGKALRTVMLLADIKAGKRKEVYDEMLDRTASLLVTIIGNVLDVRLKGQCDILRIAHVWQEPFGDDIADTLDSIIKATDSEILSRESAVELNPLVQDSITEKARLAEETAANSLSHDQLYNVNAGNLSE